MNAKTAKKLRKQVGLTTTHVPEYDVIEHRLLDKVTLVPTVVIQYKLKENDLRKKYQDAKAQYKAA